MDKEKRQKRVRFWIGVIIVIIALSLYTNYREKWEEENCELTFHRYTYNIGCAGACSVKCHDEGFSSVSSSFFEPYLTGEQMDNENLYKRCECNCGGCRER